MSSKEDWTKYEREFHEFCLSKRWKPMLDEDDSPILIPARATDQGLYKVGIWGNDVCYIAVTASHGATLTKIKKKLNKAKVAFIVHGEGETDAILLFNIERLPRIVKTLNLKKKMNHKGPPSDAIKKAHEKLAEIRAKKLGNS